MRSSIKDWTGSSSAERDLSLHKECDKSDHVF